MFTDWAYNVKVDLGYRCPTAEDRYEATHFPGLALVEFVALEANGTRYPLGDSRTVAQCREYAIDAGFSVETVRHTGGASTFTWLKAGA